MGSCDLCGMCPRRNEPVSRYDAYRFVGAAPFFLPAGSLELFSSLTTPCPSASNTRHCWSGQQPAFIGQNIVPELAAGFDARGSSDT